MVYRLVYFVIRMLVEIGVLVRLVALEALTVTISRLATVGILLYVGVVKKK